MRTSFPSRSPRVAALLAMLAAGVLAGNGCGGPGVPSRHTMIDSRDEYDPRSLDPALSTDVPTGRAVGYLFDGLTRFTPEARVEPGLAERWEASPDGMAYTFHLRRGVRFHDGRPFGARDVLASWERVLDPKVKGGRGWPLYPVLGAKEFAEGKAPRVAGVTAPNDSTVVVRLKEPFAIFPKLLAMPVTAIVPAEMGATFADHPVGTGPWKFARWEHDDYLLFAKNEAYWGGAPLEDSLMARIISEPSTAVAEFESGNVDVLLLPENDLTAWQEDAARRKLLQSNAALVFVYVGINTTRGPLKDRRVRQAINHSVDVGRMIQILASGGGRRAAGVIPPSLEGADTTRAPYAFDTLAAWRLMREAGYPNGIDVELWVGSNPLYIRMAETMQAYLKLSGIRAKIVQRESAAAREAARKGEADMILKDWYADYPDAENFLYPLLHGANKGVGGNVSFYQSATFDTLVSRARRELNDSARVQLYRQADSVAFVDAPMLFMYFKTEVLAVQPWLKGFKAPAILNGQPWTKVRIDTTGLGAR